MEALRALTCLIAALALASALPPAPAQGGAQVTDAPDDARENDSASTAALARRTACRAGGVVTGATGQCGGGDEVPAAGGEPAPATMEAISATLRDDPDFLHVTLELKEVSDGFEGAVRRDGTAGALYAVCWTTSEAPCSESVLLAAMPSAGEVALTSIFRVDTDGCNDYGRCVWRVPHELTAGSPGRISWRVPRDLLPNGTEGAVLAAPELKVTRYYSPSGRIVWPMEDGVGYAVRGPEGAATAGYAANHHIPVDGSAPGVDHRLATPAAPPRLDAIFDQLADAEGDVVGGTRADLDLLALALAETDATLTLSVQLARVDTRPDDHDLLAGFDLTGGRYVQWGYAARGGLLSPFAEVCVAPGCFLEAAPATRSIPVNVTVEPGAPGWVRATFQRADLGSPARGHGVGSIDVTAFTYDATATQALVTPAGEARTLVSGQTDTLAYAPPWRFQLDSRSTMATSGVFLADDIGDAQPPRGVEEKDRFDVAYVEAVGASPALSRVTLGIADLSNIRVPPQYRGFVYAVSFETDAGQFMVGFLRTAAGTDNQQEFFCGEDVVLFAPEPRDPNDIIRRAITGLISRQPGASAGASQRGALVFEVPHDCFGVAGDAPVQIKRMAAGAFLLPLSDVAGRLPPTPVDTVARDEPFELHASAVQAPAPAWYVNPFGIEGFWDILGIASAVGASGIGVIAVRRKRSLLKRYLAAIDAIALKDDASPGAQEKALLQLRHQVKEALILSKLDHAHYVVIDHRLDEALGKARVKSLATTFDELPARMLKRLQDLLVDGQMSRQDYRVFCHMLDESALTDEAKDRVRRRLEAWVRQDAADEAAAERAQA
ncbi:MAG TPA: hypothetical protein VNX21_09580 [Candidatus Thermoplasmatota archaeon]|nr:hypothetical protein [Candidatus Thermoplasmatota archaeon]